MTYEEIRVLQQAGSVVLVDIREHDEIAQNPGIVGSIHVPMREVIPEIEAGNIPTNKTIVTICASGGRCQMLNTALKARGIASDYLEGGLFGIN